MIILDNLSVSTLVKYLLHIYCSETVNRIYKWPAFTLWKIQSSATQIPHCCEEKNIPFPYKMAEQIAFLHDNNISKQYDFVYDDVESQDDELNDDLWMENNPRILR